MTHQTELMNSFENIVIISLDCVRHEALSCYPQRFPWPARLLSKEGTPNIDQLCAQGHRFNQAVTHAPFTPAAHASLFTGLNPPKHGIRNFVGAKLNENVETMAERLSNAGWDCGAVIGSHALSSEFGLSKGFHYYDEDIQTGIKRWHKGERRGAAEVTERATEWLKTLNTDSQFFLFVHYFDAHNISKFKTDPSNSITEYNVNSGKKLRHLVRDVLPDAAVSLIRPLDEGTRQLYYKAKGVAQSGRDWILGLFESGRDFRNEGRRFMLDQTHEVDRQVGKLIQKLSDLGRLDKTLIIILADHGDDFWEHGEPTHRKFLFDTTLAVPLIVYPKLGNIDVIEDQVRLIDIFPTILDVVGLRGDAKVDGQSLLELLESTPNIEEGLLPTRKAYSETIYEIISDNPDETEILTCYASLRTNRWKLIWDRLQDTYELYQLNIDRNERVNRVEANPDIVYELKVELQELALDMPVEGAISAEREVVKRLEALGYL